MTPLGQRIAALIAAQGPISIAEFMTLALHDREGGYYATRDTLSADFVTAPEVSQMFGELIGLWLAQAWHDQKKPKNPRLVELGPGRGTLLRDALRALKLMPEFRNALEVVLVEVSPALSKVQAETLGQLLTTLAARFPSLGPFITLERLHPSFVASLNGDLFVSDPRTVLGENDCVLILSADAGG